MQRWFNKSHCTVERFVANTVQRSSGFVFVLIGAAVVWLIFCASTRAHNQTAPDLIIRAHYVVGYLFIAFYCLI